MQLWSVVRMLVVLLCGQMFNCTDKCPDDLPHKATDMTSEQLETVCIAEPLVYESVAVIYLYVVIMYIYVIIIIIVIILFELL